jgi:hypothetical protein
MVSHQAVQAAALRYMGLATHDSSAETKRNTMTHLSYATIGQPAWLTSMYEQHHWQPLVVLLLLLCFLGQIQVHCVPGPCSIVYRLDEIYIIV